MVVSVRNADTRWSYQLMREKVERAKNVRIVGSLLYLTTNAGPAVLDTNEIIEGEHKMTDNQKTKCHAIIHSASVAAGGVGAGLAQVPGSDNLVIAPIQLTMTISLGKVFDITLGESAAKAALASAAAATVGRTASQLLIGWIPGLGNIVNATTAAGLTETIGWILAGEFDKQSSY